MNHAIALTAVLIVASVVGADEVHWINPAGGMWDSPENWSTGRIPDVLDTAVFDLPADYTVTFGIQPRYDRLIVTKGEIDFELGDRAAMCLGNELGVREIVIAGSPLDAPILRLHDGSMLAACPDSDPDDSVPEGMITIGDPDQNRPSGTLEVYSVGTFDPVLNTRTLRIRASGDGVFRVAEGSFGWSSGLSSDYSVTYSIESPAKVIVDGVLIGSSIQGDGHWTINGHLRQFDDQLEFGEALVTSTTNLYSEDFYPGIMVAQQSISLTGEWLYPGMIQFLEPGNTIGFEQLLCEIVAQIRTTESLMWTGHNQTYRFQPVVSVNAMNAPEFPKPPATFVLFEGGYASSIDTGIIASGSLELPYASDARVVATSDNPVRLWLRMAPPSWCVADQDFNGIVNFFDIVAFIHHYNAGEPWAQMNDDAELNFFDVAEYINHYLAGCP